MFDRDRMISAKEVGEIVPYTRQHIGRLERAGLFPRRIQIGAGRVAWSEREVQQWMEQQKAERPAA